MKKNKKKTPFIYLEEIILTQQFKALVILWQRLKRVLIKTRAQQHLDGALFAGSVWKSGFCCSSRVTLMQYDLDSSSSGKLTQAVFQIKSRASDEKFVILPVRLSRRT